MIKDITIEQYLAQKNRLPIIDVRSPGEFDKGHIPGAVNIPLFSNSERAHVGTVYVQENREKAIELGYKYVNPKLQWFIDESKKVANKSALAIHCWRGGMRSHAFAQHLHENGFSEIYVIKQGYKAFRNYVLQFFEQPFTLRILGGYTGSGKTFILKELQKLGQQVIDLEALAHHKGSAFGSIGEKPQPGVEQFENDLYHELSKLDIQQPIWLEDESHSIGKVFLPIKLYYQMRAQKVYFIDIPKEKRAKLLVEEYATFGNDLLLASINKIAKRMGGQNVKAAHECLAQNDYFRVAMLALNYYDKTYTKGLNARDQSMVLKIDLPGMDFEENAKRILKIIEEE